MIVNCVHRYAFKLGSYSAAVLVSSVCAGRYAIAGNLQTVVDNTAGNSLPPLITGYSAVSYGAAGLLAIMGAKGAYNHVVNPGEKLGPAVGKLVLSAVLFGAPTFLNALSATTGVMGTGTLDIATTKADVTF